jgi:hypothetical protein
MPKTANTSSSPAADERLIRIPLEKLHPHPANANVMDEAAGQLTESRFTLPAGAGRSCSDRECS